MKATGQTTREQEEAMQAMIAVEDAIAEWSEKTGYISAWSLCDYLGTDRKAMLTGALYDTAIKLLVKAGRIEELPDLAHRYRVTRKEATR